MVLGAVMALSLKNAFSSTVFNPNGEKNAFITIMPQGWSFFSIAPREEQFVILDENLELAAQWPNMRASNIFGLNRKGRAEGIEAGRLYQKVHSDEKYCALNLENCIDFNKMIDIENDSPDPSFCGKYVIAHFEAVPWSWAEITDLYDQPSRYVEVSVSCPS